MGQLTLDGGEVSRTSRAALSQPLSDIQRAVLDELRRRGSLRSVEAGVIVHERRERGCGEGRRAGAGGGLGCCPYAATDGNELLKRLAERGLVARAGRGRWVAMGSQGR